MLEREREAAGLGVHAETRRLADPVRERHVEHLHVDLADVAAHPFLEDVDQESAVLLGRHRASGHLLSRLDAQWAVAPGRPRNGAVLVRLGDALDDRNELHEAGVALVAEEAVDVAAAPCIGGVDRRQCVPLDTRVAEVPEPADDLVERPVAALVDAVRVMKLARAVESSSAMRKREPGYSISFERK